VKIAVYDRFWPTAGGGEKFAAGIAAVLADDHDVDLLGHDDVDLADLGERLQLDLDAVDLRRVPLEPGEVEAASEDYDLLINASFTSIDRSAAGAGIYVVHFPQQPLVVPSLAEAVARRIGPWVTVPGVRIEARAGWHPEEHIGRHRVRWTNGSAELRVHVPPGTTIPLTLAVARVQPREIPAIALTVTVDGATVLQTEVRRTESRADRLIANVRFEVTGPADGAPVEVRIESDSFHPADVLGGDDDRVLGVAVAGVVAGDPVRGWVARRFPWVARRPGPPEWLRSYDLVVSNSEYTRLFVQRWWEVDDGLLNPPVTVQPRGEKAPIILSVGRFFDAEGGHSKKQLEMVRAFRSLLDRGLDGWELHLVGGCGPADRVYLERVRHAAAGLPVVLHVDAPGAELRDLYSRASIYWHATGLGEDPVRHPDRFEHFGITTVEAMSAGAVPVVIGHAGQLEVVDHGVNGFHWYTLDELIAHTRQVIGDDALRARLSDAAAQKAQHYAMPAFAERVHHFVDEALRVRRAASHRKAEDVAS
jgi:glycosyltransferase involved in cell wall biosynthesis